MIYGHGNDKYRYAGKVKADFSSNVWYKPMPVAFYDHLKSAISHLHDYPSPDAFGLKQELARFHNLPVNKIWVTNGSVEGIYLVARIFSGSKTAIMYPCFSEYEDACNRYGHRLSFYLNSQDWHKQSISEDLVWFGNPNNPDGKTIELSKVENLLVNNPNTLFVIDEVYAELCTGFESAVSLLKKFNNLIIIRSFTKAFAIPGIRLGYVLAPEEVTGQLADASIPWAVNSMAIEAGRFILQNYQACLPGPGEVDRETKLFRSRLCKSPGLVINSSGCNFFLVELKSISSGKLKKYLVEKHGILIRDASNFRGLDERFVRLSVQKDEHIELLVNILKKQLQ